MRKWTYTVPICGLLLGPRSFRSLHFASISMSLKGHGNEADFLIFYLMLIFSDFAVDHGLINYTETKAKGCHLKNLPVKGL